MHDLNLIIERPEPGIYPRVPAALYHGWTGASQSRLKTLGDRTPAHALEEMQNPAPSTPAKELGTAIHVATLEPDLFDLLYPPKPDVGKGPNSNAYKAAVDEIMARNPFARFLASDGREVALRVAQAIHAHPEARELLAAGGNREQSVVWRDPETGVACKARFDDWVPGATLLDVKSTLDAGYDAMAKALANFGYDVQSGLYTAGAEVLGLDTPHFTIIAAEKRPPWAVAVYRVHDHDVFRGRERAGMLLKTWRECEEAGAWPAYPTDIQDITAPEWVQRQHDREWEMEPV